MMNVVSEQTKAIGVKMKDWSNIVDIDLNVPTRPPGYCFIEFEDARDAEDAIRSSNGYNFDWHGLKLEPAHGGRGLPLVISASLRSSTRFRSHGEEDDHPQWLMQLELLKTLQGEGHHSDDDEFSRQSRAIRGVRRRTQNFLLCRATMKMGMPAEYEHVVGQQY
ncbi:hypothetical protein SUGI_0713460 [Cryptomeria japonica]|nr:hypothetical protein SUGI_0713460 [Cryptomeria japonica]